MEATDGSVQSLHEASTVYYGKKSVDILKKHLSFWGYEDNDALFFQLCKHEGCCTVVTKKGDKCKEHKEEDTQLRMTVELVDEDEQPTPHYIEGKKYKATLTDGKLFTATEWEALTKPIPAWEAKGSQKYFGIIHPQTLADIKADEKKAEEPLGTPDEPKYVSGLVNLKDPKPKIFQTSCPTTFKISPHSKLGKAILRKK